MSDKDIQLGDEVEGHSHRNAIQQDETQGDEVEGHRFQTPEQAEEAAVRAEAEADDDEVEGHARHF